MARPGSVGLNRHGAAFWMLCGLAAPGLALGADYAARQMNPSSGAAATLLDFDIPAQPLGAALDRYASISSRPAFFPSDLVAGRSSSAVRGRYSSGAALQRLLEGSGLVAEKLDSDLGETFALVEAVKAAAPRADIAELFRGQGYPGVVQARVWQALCADARTAPGRYRSLFRFQVDAAGRVNDARVLGTSGEVRRDMAIVETLQRVRIELPPPTGMAQQALTMMLVPDAAGAGSQCAPEPGAH